MSRATPDEVAYGSGRYLHLPPAMSRFCEGCPDHEACSQGATCSQVKAAASAPVTAEPKRSVYLAGPIDQVSEAEPAVQERYWGQRATLIRLLTEAGFAVYDPCCAWVGINLREHECSAVAEANNAALDAADYLVAFLPVGVPTTGTYEEIERACKNGQPAVVIGADTEVLPTGSIRVTEVTHAVRTVEGWRRPITGATIRKATITAEPRRSLAFTVNEGVGEWALPTRHYIDDAALDLWVTSAVTVNHQQFVDVPAGCRVELPPDTFALILGRSSAIRRRGILVVTGVIDVGYRGDLFVGCYNVSGHPQTLSRGERIGQLVILPNLTQGYVPQRVDALTPHERGEAGFGSTGGYEERTG